MEQVSNSGNLNTWDPQDNTLVMHAEVRAVSTRREVRHKEKCTAVAHQLAKPHTSTSTSSHQFIKNTKNTHKNTTKTPPATNHHDHLEEFRKQVKIARRRNSLRRSRQQPGKEQASSTSKLAAADQAPG